MQWHACDESEESRIASTSPPPATNAQWNKRGELRRGCCAPQATLVGGGWLVPHWFGVALTTDVASWHRHPFFVAVSTRERYKTHVISYQLRCKTSCECRRAPNAESLLNRRWARGGRMQGRNELVRVPWARNIATREEEKFLKRKRRTKVEGSWCKMWNRYSTTVNRDEDLPETGEREA